ncbi:hypothetical protein E1A91_A02G104800v1 [Gossypium mustelinum]|uniref:RNA helicase n=1 Tax=Gossypium mustelinum TaxID=34275 RepID=A0A5D3A862_GOSMU|nr:hypothetical protein E1A91_A02G104800v1 [Gossypium mustelinum]
MSANGCFPNIITATPPLLGWHRNHTVTSLETPANYCHFHLRCFIRCAASTHPITDHLLLSHSDSDSGSDWSLSPSPNTNPNPNSADSGSKGLTVAFTRLKAKRVKALVKKIKQEEKSIGDDNNDDNRGVSEGGSYPKNAEPERSFAISHFRGWADGGSISKPKLNSPHLPKKYLTLSTGAGSDFFSRKTFANLGCSEYMIKSLKQQLFLRPSHIQAKAFGPVIEGQSCIIADQSGSGKTLAYLAPLVRRLREEELQGVSKSSSGSPRAVIIVPTAELASQVLNSCRSLSKFGVPFRSMVVTGGFRQKTQLENLEQSVDVLIATPGRFMFLIKEGFLQLANLRSAVFDEVDILFNDEDFKVALQCLIDSSPVVTQYLFVTATLPVEIYNRLVEFFPDTKVIMGPGMHHISSGLEEVLVDCSGEGTFKTPDTAFLNKKTALLKLVEESPVSKTIVFCNKERNSCANPTFSCCSGTRNTAYKHEGFTHSQPRGDSLILVCTDRASRGIDFAGVDHVVLFDFPRDPSEYVRRVGRTARGAGGKGKAFIFVVGKQVPLARKIIERNQKGHPLHEVPAAF